jgi:exo-1,4-beta-D-glucosaminidase
MAQDLYSSYPLRDGWKVQEGNNTYRTSIPATAMGILIKNGVYKPDVLNGLNYKQVDKSHFDHPWLFRNYFKLPALKHGQHVFLKLDGISYSANVLVNEKLIASRDTIRGPFRQHLLDITKWVSRDNVLTIQVFRAKPGDFNIGFVDWNPRPADESMGIFRDVSIQIVGDVLMDHVAVHSKVDTGTLKEAWLTLETQLTNLTDHVLKGAIVGKLEDKSIYFPVSLKAGEKRVVKVTSNELNALDVKNPRLWWCNNLGTPDLYNMSLEFDVQSQVSDKCNLTFGIREIKDYLTPEGYRGFVLNGKKVLLRGAGWTDDIFLRNTPDSYDREIQFVKDMNLNTIRMENFWGNSQALYDLCDKNGIMVLPGWSCQWEWKEYVGVSEDDKYGCVRSEADMNLVSQELKDQVLWLRNHPSIIGWFVGSDKLPRPELENRYRHLLSEIDDRPYITSAQKVESELSGPSGTKMEGPYEYVGPKYWFVDTKYGGAYGFNTETSIGAQLPVKESLEQMIPADKLWPVNNEYYNYHCAASKSGMNTLDVLSKVINLKFGGAFDLDDYLKKADLLNYDATRSMFEAFRVNIPHTTGLIQWMLNSAWPSLYWQLYDSYGNPTTAYYSVKAANAPQQLIYDYKDNSVYLVNEGIKPLNLSANIKLLDLNSDLLQDADSTVTIDPYTTVKLFTLNPLKNNGFLFLLLKGADGKEVTENTYCLAAHEDVYDWDQSTWFETPLKEAADYKALASLPATSLELTAKQMYRTVDATLKNTSNKVSFFNRLALMDANGKLVEYAKWSNNYVTLQPGETKELHCSFAESLKGLSLKVTGWNTKEQTIKIQ